jgi:hypothetical protein
MHPHRRLLLAAALAAWALAGCGSSQPALPSFPDYPPAAVYLDEQARLREQVQAVQAYQARERLRNQMRAALRADAMWRRSEELRAQRNREVAFRETLRRHNAQLHFEELREYQSLQ